MSKVFIGDITAEAERLLSKYLNKYMPDVVLEPLKASGIKGKIKNHARRPDVLLVILNENLYDMCVGVADDVLSLPKVHKYVSDSGFKLFLEEKFGVLDGDKSTVSNEVVSNDIVDEVLDDLVISDESDTSNDNDKDEIIRKLNDELIVCNTVIRNLEAQIEEKSGSDDVSHFINRIKSLETELETVKAESSKIQTDSYADLGKVARAEQIIDKVDKLTEDLKAEKRKYAQLESDKLALEIDIKSVTKDYEDLKLKQNSDESKILELENNLNSLQSEYSSKLDEISELISKNTVLDEQVKELTKQLSELSILQEEVTTLTSSNEKLNEDIAELKGIQVEYNNIKVDYETCISDKASLESKVTSLKDEISTLKDKLKEVNEAKSSLDSTIKTLQDELSQANIKADSTTSTNDELETKLKEVESEKEVLVNQINSLSLKLASKDDKIEQLLNNLSTSEGVSLELEQSKLQITDLRSEIDTLSTELKSKEGLDLKILELTKSLESLNDDYSSLENERNSLTSKLEQKNKDLNEKTSTISELTSQVDDLSLKLEESDKAKSDLESKNKKLSSEIDVLKQETTNSNSLLETSSMLESELKDSKRKVVKLESEVKILKQDLDKERNSSSKDLEIAKLRTSISDYKEQIRDLKSSLNNKSKESSDEVVQLRKRCADLELSLIDKDSALKANNDNICVKMSNLMSPKTMLNLSIDIDNHYKNMFLFASGSSESNLLTYQTIKRVCTSLNCRVLVVDLVTDSYIDRELGVSKVLSPIDFLQGLQPVSDCISKSKLNNTMVLSTAFSYLNSLYLLSVDWNYILSSLQSLADVIIINVGCLNDMISKILFNTFSAIMKSHIIVKASPINLRTALLSLTGIPLSSNSLISCVNFEDSSKQMYQRLAQKFNTQILKDSEVLKL